MQAPPQAKPPVGVVFDSDFGNTIDSVLALALLHGFDQKNEARVAAVSTTKSNLKSAAFCEVMARFYSAAPPSSFGMFRSVAIGMADDGKMAEDTPLLAEPLAKKNADGKPVYLHAIERLNETAEVAALIRNSLTAQVDQNAIVVLAGPATNLASVLRLPGAKELIEGKVRMLVVLGGAYPDGGPEANLKRDVTAAKRLFAEWPTPIVACGRDAGDAVLFPAASIEKDFAWSSAHPVVDAYKANHEMPYDAPTHDMTAVLYAVRPQEGYFKVSAPGTIRVGDDGRTTFAAAESGKHRYIIYDPEQKERIVKVYTEIASIKPVPRFPRFRPQQDQQKKEELKKEEPKKDDVK
jgi:inosine-uridine nucleoside N-ribohydrolase